MVSATLVMVRNSGCVDAERQAASQRGSEQHSGDSTVHWFTLL